MSIVLSNYDVVLELLKKEIESGDFKAQQAYMREKLLSYWRMGKIIADNFPDGIRGDYGKGLFEKLAKDISINASLLYRIKKFYLTYPNLKAETGLSWSHYKQLINIKDPKVRKQIESIADKENWTARLLEERIQKINKIEELKDKKVTLTSTRGKLYTYKVKKLEFLKDKYIIDCGFKISYETRYKEKEGIVSVEKKKDKFEIKEYKIDEENLYCYRAIVEEIIDGDTIWLQVDCGFGIWLLEKVRLKGIDADAVLSSRGKEAKEFIEKKLKKVKFVTIKTYHRDKYDRRLVDVFYLPKEQNPQKVMDKGNYLNQELLDKGLVVRV